MRANLSRSFTHSLFAPCAALLLLLSAATAAQTPRPVPQAQQPARADVQIIPRPRQLTVTGGDFKLSRRTRLALADPRSEDDRFAAEDFIEDVRQTADLALRVGNRRDRETILVGALAHPAVQSALTRAELNAPANLND